MIRWKAMIALLSAMLYLPAAGHCLLEQASWLPMEGGCCDPVATTDAAPTLPCSYGCCPSEYAVYLKPGETEASLLPADLPVCVTILTLDSARQQSPPVSPESSPPELAKVWQFTNRAASSPRAPSSVS